MLYLSRRLDQVVFCVQTAVIVDQCTSILALTHLSSRRSTCDSIWTMSVTQPRCLRTITLLSPLRKPQTQAMHREYAFRSSILFCRNVCAQQPRCDSNRFLPTWIRQVAVDWSLNGCFDRDRHGILPMTSTLNTDAWNVCARRSN